MCGIGEKGKLSLPNLDLLELRGDSEALGYAGTHVACH
jgi:hypothetical protein